MPSNVLGSCCYQGVKHEGQPCGRIENIGETEIYISEPTSSASNGYGILYLTDIIGHKFVNAQLLADQYAENGYVVVVPDLFHGDPVPFNSDMATFSIPTWMQGAYGAKKVPHTPPNVDPIVQAGLDTLRQKHNCKKIALVGYCFGAKYAVRFLGSGQVDVGFIGHPAMVEKKELEGVKRPLALAAAETDDIFPANMRHDFEETLRKLEGVPYQINLYSGVTHGFGVRCDPKVRAQRFAKESAFFQALQWFEEHLRDKVNSS
ncbi:putative dienelactone hydrolase [Leptodontidium sp. 2 PMI_412]|nr:putative dienelactone hydrolase [Leptodontidium sp. 2 PMI_412]